MTSLRTENFPHRPRPHQRRQASPLQPGGQGGPQATLTPKLITRGKLTIDLDRRIVCQGAEELHLTRKEHEVLGMLARHSGRVMTHERILAACWGVDEDPRIEYLRIVIRSLRQKLEAPNPVGSVIANELGVGYRLLVDG